ncbi:MAG: ribosome-associated translation inhibitor RaiA [Alphaproteobacteria bacterium]|nr:ribosome-associated translation inhibitor RaiA [Alphaproteobacteria bacterium]
MQITVTGHQVEVGEALQKNSKAKLEKLVTKFFAHAIDAHIIFEKHKVFFQTEIKVHERTQSYAVAKAEDLDIHKSFDKALEKIESQLRKYKSKLRAKHHKEK